MLACAWRRDLVVMGASAVCAALLIPTSAHAEVTPWLSASAGGDSRGSWALDSRAGVAIDGLNCRFIEGETGLRLSTTDTASASFDERVTVCPWDLGLLDMTFDQELSWQVEPRLADRYGFARQAYTRSSWSVSISMFDFLNFYELPEDDGQGGELPLSAIVGVRDERVLFMPFTIRNTTTTQDDFELREVQVSVSALRWWKAQPGGRRTLDILGFEISGIEESGTGVGVALGALYLGKLSSLRLGRHLEVDAELGVVGAGTMSGSSGRIETPEPLYGVSAGVGKLELRGAWPRAGIALTGARTLYPTMALGLSLEERVTGVVQMDLGDALGGTGTTLTLQGFAARTENRAADGSRLRDATYGGGATLTYALPEDFSLEITAEAARSFYPVLDGHSPEAAPAARAIVSLRFDLGDRAR